MDFLNSKGRRYPVLSFGVDWSKLEFEVLTNNLTKYVLPFRRIQ